jgi:hypothetical protein
VPRFYRSRLSLALFLFISSCVLAQQPPTPPPPHERPIPPQLPAVDQQQTVAYWTTETGWNSELQLRNNALSQDLTVTPALRLADGAETSLAPVTIKPQEVTSIDIGAAISAAGSPNLVGTYGSIVLRYSSPSERVLYAALMVHRVGYPIAFHTDAMGESPDFQDGSREGIWWLPKDSTSDYLILTNQGSNPIPLALSLYNSVGKENKQRLILGAFETRRYSVRKLAQTAGLTGSYGGIKVAATAHAGSLDTLHFLFDETAGFSAILKMFDYDPTTPLQERDYAHTGVWTQRAPMLALSNPDPALAFPAGTTLHPQLFIRNTTAKPTDVALRFNWRTASATGPAPGPALHLSPYETRLIDVTTLQGAGTLPKEANWTSVTLTTTGLPDEIVAVAASYDSSLRYGAQTPFSDQLTFKWEGGMWEYDPYHNSIITAGNGGTKPTRAAFTIFYNQGTQRYDLEQTLQPDEQMWIDVGKLVREQVPDKNGKPLPSDLTMGSYEFRDLTHTGVGTLFEGKIIYDKTYGHVTYGCSTCCGYSIGYVRVFYDPLGVPFQSTAGQGVNAYENCYQTWDDVSDSFWSRWASANTGIVTVDYYGTHNGVSVGSTTSNTSGYLDGAMRPPTCPLLLSNPKGGANVIKLQVQGNSYNSIFVGTDSNLEAANSIFATVSPSGGTFTIVSSATGDTFTSVPAGGPGWVVHTTIASAAPADRTITVTYTVSGQGTVTKKLTVTARQFAYLTNNSPNNTCTLGYGTTQLYTYTPYTHPDKAAVPAGIGLSGTAVAETFNPQPPAGTVTGDGSLNANSQFGDRISYCSSSPLTISTTITQTLSIEGYQVRQNTLKYSSAGVTYTNLGPTQ